MNDSERPSRNVEIKARLRDPARARRIAALLSGGEPRRIEQTDVFFRVPSGRLKLRTFADGAGELIQYDRPDQAGPKTSRYRVVQCADPVAVGEALAAACGVRGTVWKQRDLYLVGATRIHIDRVEGLGDFLELEIVLEPDQSSDDGEAVARDLAAQLGIAESDLVDRAYIDLLEEKSPSVF